MAEPIHTYKLIGRIANLKVKGSRMMGNYHVRFCERQNVDERAYLAYSRIVFV